MTPFPSNEPRVSILLVDDRPDKLLALEATLSGLGENLVLAHSGKEALRCLLQQDFAVILLDVNMPVMDGFETAALIRQRKSSELTPIIFVSAIDDSENHLSRGYSLGAVDYIRTPVVPEILRAKVGFFVDLFKKTEQVKRQAEERAEFLRAQAARAEAEAAETRAAFLAEASRTLAASLDRAETLREVARLAVPALADFCAVDILEKDGAVSLMAVRHVFDPDRESAFRAFRERCPTRLNDASLVAQTLRSGVTTVFDPDRLPFTEIPCSEERRALLENFGLHAAVVVPLAARGRILGAISLATTASGRSYGALEISLAEELAQRAALAVDNALLYAAAQEARETAENANAAKDRFLAMLSHELRTPLTPVLNTVHALVDAGDLTTDLRTSLEMIRRNVELEARLIDDLLDLTRISKGKVQLRLENVDAHVLISSALDICGDEIRAKNLSIAVDLAATGHHLHADAARLRQVFWNLLKNAVKFTPPGGQLLVRSLNPLPDRIRLEVADTGIGIPPEALSKIFDAFEQGERGQGHGGLGLGLAIAKAILELHEGASIEATSPGIGQGATFRLEFSTVPAVEAKPPVTNGVQNMEEPVAIAKSTQQPHVLLVDDHADTLRSMRRLLRQRGYQVSTAPSVSAALESAAASQFDLLISDVGLPDGSGLDLMRELRARSGGETLLGIALSGYGMEEDIARSHAAGFSEHLTKPVDLPTLEIAMHRLLNHSANNDVSTTTR